MPQTFDSLFEDWPPNEDEFESPAWHEAVLKERARVLAAGETTVSDWDEVKERLRRLFGGDGPPEVDESAQS